MLIKIIPNPKKQWAKEIAKEVKLFLISQNSKQNPKQQNTERFKFVTRGAEVTICIGGDGTILYANHKGKIEGTILGIGSEKSYICQLNQTNWKQKILVVLDRNVTKTIKIMTIQAEVNGENYTAINDFVIHATHYRVAEIEIDVDNKLSSFEGDGLIVSSSIGSTGYAYSAGGEKLAPENRKIEVIPICPYKRTFSAQTITENSLVTVTPGNDCAFILDGIFIKKLKKGERVKIQKGPNKIFFEGVGK